MSGTSSGTVVPIRSASPGVQSALDGLLPALAGSYECLQKLVEIADAKLAAIRAAEAAELHRLAGDEREVLERLMQCEQSRREGLARLAQTLQCPALPGTLSQIARLLPSALASALTARARGLADAAEKLRRKNSLVASVAQDLQGLIRGVFTDVTRCGQESIVYRANGKPALRDKRMWVDAVG